MPYPLRIRKLFSSFFGSNLYNKLRGRVAEFQPLEISEADDHPIIPTDLSSRQFPQKELLTGVKALLPEILEESKKYGDNVQIFVAITVEEPEVEFYFTLKDKEEATNIILEWAQSYQNKNYMLPPLMTIVYWGFTPIIW